MSLKTRLIDENVSLHQKNNVLTIVNNTVFCIKYSGGQND